MNAVSFLGRRRRLFILLFFLACYPLVFVGAERAWFSTANRVIDWLPKEFEETQRLLWFAQHFGSDEILMISWEGCRLDDPRLPRLAGALTEPVEGAGPDGQPAPYFRLVMTTPEVLKTMTEPPLELSPSEAVERLEGWLIGPDGTCCALALVSEAGIADREAAVDWAYHCAEEACGLPPEELIVAGSTIDGVAIDRISLAALLEVNIVSLAICLVLTCLFLRSVRLALLVFVSAVYSQHLSMALVYYTGSQMDSVLLMIASLSFVLATSGAIHLVNYYVDAARGRGLAGAPRRAFRHALIPCGLATLTTSIGLLSLTVSKIVPIARFGGYGAAAILAGLAVIFLWIPTVLEQWPPQGWFARLEGRSTAADKDRIWPWFAAGVTRHHGKIMLLVVLAMALAGWYVRNLQTTARLHDLLPGDSKVIQDYHWMERNIGPLVPVEVVLVIPEGNEAPILRRLELVQRVRGAIEEIDVVGTTIAATDFAPPLPSRSLAGYAERAVLQRKLQRHRQDYIDTGFLANSDEGELWRISVRVPASQRVNYNRVMNELHAKVDPLVASEPGMPGARAVFAGGVPLVHKAQDQLLADLIESLLLAFVLIAIAMAILLRNPIAGLLSMIPNLLPGVLVFGMLGWLDVRIEIGTVMTASVALGVAVDGTLHFVTWFRRGILEGRDRRQAVEYAYTRCATAMWQSSMICGLGLLVFAYSDFVPIHRFGWLMFTMLAAALVSDVIVTPAMLCGPLGRFFEPRRRPAGPPPEGPPPVLPQPSSQ